jgi:hypothetical protein
MITLPPPTRLEKAIQASTGAFLRYVNYAVLTLPNLTKIFYGNNSGTAKVTVTRIMADEIIAPPPEETVQAQVHDGSPR